MIFIRKILFFLILSIRIYANIEVYEKKYALQDSFLYINLNLDKIASKIYKNDELIILKSINKNSQKFYFVKTKDNKKGIIKDIITNQQIFPNNIYFSKTSNSYLIYSLNSDKTFKKIEKNDSFKIEENPRAEDEMYIYYLSSLNFILKINKFDNFHIKSN